ncbi:hypothetical protein BH11BAC7_BH11BAC7_21540 [soil metagenome]
MFCNVELPQLQKLSSEKTSSVYKKGQAIFYEDRQPHGVYLIRHEEGKIIITDKDRLLLVAMNDTEWD